MTDTAPLPSPDDAFRALEETRGTYAEVLATLANRSLAYICVTAAEMAPDVAFIEVEHGNLDYSGYHTTVGYFTKDFAPVDDTDDLDDELLNSAAFMDLDDATLPHFEGFIIERGRRRFLDLTKVRDSLTA